MLDRLLTNTTRFGWVNASYVVGLSIITVHMRRALGTLTTYETFAKATAAKIEEEGDSDLDGDYYASDEAVLSD